MLFLARLADDVQTGEAGRAMTEESGAVEHGVVV